MSSTTYKTDSMAIDVARECFYRLLSIALTDPRTPEWGDALDSASLHVAVESADLLREVAHRRNGDLAFGELPADYLDARTLISELQQSREQIGNQYDQVFGLLVPRECPPYETEYHTSADAFFRSQQLADIAGFYRAFGLETSRRHPERPDHVSLELEFLAFLLLKKRLALVGKAHGLQPVGLGRVADASLQNARLCAEAYRKFFAEHVAWWVPAFCVGLRRKARSGLYAAAAELLASFIAVERQRLKLPPGTNPVQPIFIERPEEQSGCAGCPLPG